MNGSDPEPQVPLAQDAAEQMRDATDRLREQAWMVTPMTSPSRNNPIGSTPTQPEGCRHG